MPKLPTTRILLAGLEASGYVEVQSSSKKYRQFQKEGETFNMFLGPAGALRKGRLVTSSVSLEGTSTRRMIFAAGEAALKQKVK